MITYQGLRDCGECFQSTARADSGRHLRTENKSETGSIVEVKGKALLALRRAFLSFFHVS